MHNNYLSPSHLLIEECKRLRKSIQPISSKYEAQRLFSAYNNNTYYPIVLLLGNHSSGKSSFINYLLQRKVQTTGVAPTDDNFTIIGPSNEDIDRNGPALVGDPDLGFSELKSFGPVLVNHTQLKLRSNIAINDFMIVDSPGMIDSPNKTTQHHISHNKDTQQQPVGMDRGYNFQGVCKWYADRADVILLFFDPDKPGTTGETLSILTSSLVGLDHKMYIILNKADQFNKIHDFARAYGSLCWNLSKVIPRKDLPRIHTMCLPLKSTTTSAKPIEDNIMQSVDSSARSLDAQSSSIIDNQSDKAMKTFSQQGIHDLEESRSEVIRETLNAPRRRVDNEISRLTESVNALLMHCTIVDRMLAIYQNKLWRSRGIMFFTVLSSIGITIGVNYICDYLFEKSSKRAIYSNNKQDRDLPNTLNPPAQGITTSVSSTNAIDILNDLQSKSAFEGLWKLQSKAAIMLWTSLSGITMSGLVTFWQQYTLKSLLQRFQEQSYCEDIYRQLYKQEIADGDESTIGLGKLVLNGFGQVMHPTFVQSSSRVQKFEFYALQRILSEDIASLRRKTSPVFQSLSPPHIMMTPTCSSDRINLAEVTTTNSRNTQESMMISNATQLMLSQHNKQHMNRDDINRNILSMENNSFSSPLLHVTNLMNSEEEFTTNNNNSNRALVTTESSETQALLPLSSPLRKKTFTSKENKIDELIAKYNKILNTPGSSNSNNSSGNSKKSLSLTKPPPLDENNTNTYSSTSIHTVFNNINSSYDDDSIAMEDLEDNKEEEEEEVNVDDRKKHLSEVFNYSQDIMNEERVSINNISSIREDT